MSKKTAGMTDKQREANLRNWRKVAFKILYPEASPDTLAELFGGSPRYASWAYSVANKAISGEMKFSDIYDLVANPRENGETT